jgi:chromosome segregation ATPase
MAAEVVPPAAQSQPSSRHSEREEELEQAVAAQQKRIDLMQAMLAEKTEEIDTLNRELEALSRKYISHSSARPQVELKHNAL